MVLVLVLAERHLGLVTDQGQTEGVMGPAESEGKYGGTFQQLRDLARELSKEGIF